MSVPNCELCGEDWFDETAGDQVEEIESIEETKRCTACVDEWGKMGLWPDQW